MFRSMLCSMVVMGLFVGFAAAEDTKKTDTKATDSKDKKAGHEKTAKITKVDSKKGTVTVSMKGKDGKTTSKTFKLAEDIEYADSTGKVATIDVFTSGDMVLIVEREGKISKMTKKDKKDKAGTTEKKSDSKGPTCERRGVKDYPRPTARQLLTFDMPLTAASH